MRGRMMVVAGALAASALGGWTAQTLLGTGAAGAASSSPSSYVATNPYRVLDTRSGPRPGDNSTLTVFPGAAGATAVGVNIALTDTAGAGFVTAWAGDTSLPLASSINSSFPGENISNFVIVPLAADGTFKLYANSSTHIVVDVMGFFVGGTVPPPSGLTGVITGYGPGFSLTTVSGSVSNGTGATVDVRADVRCPNGTVEIDFVFDLLPGQTRGFDVLCDGVFSSGASLSLVEV